MNRSTNAAGNLKPPLRYAPWHSRQLHSFVLSWRQTIIASWTCAAIAALLALTAPFAYGQTTTMYRCGNTFSQSPCGENSKEIVIKTPDPCMDEANKYSSQCFMRPSTPPTVSSKKQAEEATRKATEYIPDEPPSPTALARNKTLCTDGVKAKLRDPESARFSDIRRNPPRNLQLGNGTWLPRVVYELEVNAKNAYGGYSGKRPWQCIFSIGETELIGAYAATLDR